MTYATQAQVYSLIGVDNTAISESTINEYLNQADAEVERIIKTTCKPKIVIEKFTGKGTDTTILRNKPLLNVLDLKISDTSISTEYLEVKETGEVHLGDSAEYSIFSSLKNDCKIMYTYGWLEEDSDVDQEYLSSDFEAGDDKSIDVTNSDNYVVGEYVKIEGTDGNYEIIKIKTSSENVITVDLTEDHEENSLLTKMKVPKIVSDLSAVLAAIKGSTYMIGNTYTFATSYSMPDYSVTKGVPYPHFNRNLEQNIAQRNYLIKQLTAFPVFA